MCVCTLVACRHTASLCLHSNRLFPNLVHEEKKKSKLSPQLLACQMRGLAPHSLSLLKGLYASFDVTAVTSVLQPPRSNPADPTSTQLFAHLNSVCLYLSHLVWLCLYGFVACCEGCWGVCSLWMALLWLQAKGLGRVDIVDSLFFFSHTLCNCTIECKTTLKCTHTHTHTYTYIASMKSWPRKAATTQLC